jgi:acyl carrier protein
MKTTEEAVITALKENTSWDGEIKMEQTLRDELGIDSFGVLMIINTLEDEFGIEISNEDIEGLGTVADIINRLNEILSVNA